MVEVTIRPIQIGDAEKCFRWVSNPEVRQFLGLIQSARTLAQERSWIAAMLTDKSHHRAFIIEDERGIAIGTCGLRAIDTGEGTALLGMMIGEPRLWGRGYGTAATRALLRYAFEELELREIRLSCHKDNVRALRCYQNAGFDLQPDAHRRPATHRDETWMVITRNKWEEIKARGACPNQV